MVFFFFSLLFFNKACFVRKPLPSASAFSLAANCLLADDIFHALPRSPPRPRLCAGYITWHFCPLPPSGVSEGCRVLEIWSFLTEVWEASSSRV